jgi:hypothetical protein
MRLGMGAGYIALSFEERLYQAAGAPRKDIRLCPPE